MRYLLTLIFLSFISALSSAQCVDSRGYTIPEIPNYQLNDVALATRLNDGSPAIFFNPSITKNMAPPTRLFFTLHECAHHILGHINGSVVSVSKEQEADCWAIKMIVSRRLVSPKGFKKIQENIFDNSPGDATHIPGPQRAANLEKCLH